MAAIPLKARWPAVLALAATGLALALCYPATRSQRLTNLDLSASGFPDTYVMHSKSERDRVFVVNRRDSTLRRGDAREPGRKWRIDRFRGPGATADTLLVRSKRLGKGSVFYVPVAEVADWSYPFLYTFVRQLHPELELPEVGWTQLYVDRVYRGLYLRVALPFDRRKKDAGSGVLRELLTVRDGRLRWVDTRFDDAPGVYNEAVAAGAFPELAPPPAALAWLARRAPTEGTTFLLSNRPPWRLELLPLPVSLPTLFEALHGRPPAAFEDDRYAIWVEADWRSPAPAPFTAEQRAELAGGFALYAADLRAALRGDGELHRTLAALRADLGSRQAAVASLELSLGEI